MRRLLEAIEQVVAAITLPRGMHAKRRDKASRVIKFCPALT